MTLMLLLSIRRLIASQASAALSMKSKAVRPSESISLFKRLAFSGVISSIKNGQPKSADVIVKSFSSVVFPVSVPPVSMMFFSAAMLLQILW
ncbi:hypothetical protein D3C86_1984650 [compost metagenome]